METQIKLMCHDSFHFILKTVCEEEIMIWVMNLEEILISRQE